MCDKKTIIKFWLHTVLELDFTPMNRTSLERISGTYLYEAAPPMEASMFDKSSLVFRVEDQSSPGDYVYQWMVNVQFNNSNNNTVAESSLVDLTPYSCRTVNVSYAIASDMGMSSYSPAAVIQVPGKISYNSVFHDLTINNLIQEMRLFLSSVFLSN